jgi:two-component system sensor histidine kinase ChiS
VRSISAYAPIIDDHSDTLLAVLCIDVIDANVDAALTASRNTSLIIIGISLVLSLIISIILGNTFARGILALDGVVQLYVRKDFSARSSIRSNDEIGRLGFSLNYMAETIQDYAATLEKLLASFSRFVPRKFLEFLNKESISDVQLGDQIQKEMTILFSDIRSFTTLSESMTPAETFNFINSYLSRVGPAIRLYNGFIDKYIGDGIMALFPGEPDDAVTSAITMMRKVDEYNEHRVSSGYKPIKIGIAIHTGLLMLGAIGEDERMDGSVISDAVNICSRMEKLTKLYQVSIIISRETLDKLNTPDKYHIRFLDKVQVKGKNVPVSLYEVYDADPVRILEKKDMSKEALEYGITLYFDGKNHEALEIFSSLSNNYSDDAVVRLYLARCEKLMKHEASGDGGKEEMPE